MGPGPGSYFITNQTRCKYFANTVQCPLSVALRPYTALRLRDNWLLSPCSDTEERRLRRHHPRTTLGVSTYLLNSSN